MGLAHQQFLYRLCWLFWEATHGSSQRPKPQSVLLRKWNIFQNRNIKLVWWVPGCTKSLIKKSWPIKKGLVFERWSIKLIDWGEASVYEWWHDTLNWKATFVYPCFTIRPCVPLGCVIVLSIRCASAQLPLSIRLGWLGGGAGRAARRTQNYSLHQQYWCSQSKQRASWHKPWYYKNYRREWLYSGTSGKLREFCDLPKGSVWALVVATACLWLFGSFEDQQTLIQRLDHRLQQNHYSRVG